MLYYDGSSSEFNDSTPDDSHAAAVALALCSDASGSIDTLDVDAFRQGVELQTPQQFTQGVVKIWSGWLQHMLPQQEFGELQRSPAGVTPFDERQKLDPVAFVRAGDQQAAFEDFSVPMNYIDGAIDPFGSRNGTPFGFPRDPHGIRGTLLSGNEDELGNSDVVSSDFDPMPVIGSDPFYDDTRRLDVYFYETPVPLRPKRSSRAYSDNLSFDPGLDMPPSASSEFYVARRALNPGDYLPPRVPVGLQSAGSGFTYDSAPMGVDSIAFGGLTF